MKSFAFMFTLAQCKWTLINFVIFSYSGRKAKGSYRKSVNKPFRDRALVLVTRATQQPRDLFLFVRFSLNMFLCRVFLHLRTFYMHGMNNQNCFSHSFEIFCFFYENDLDYFYRPQTKLQKGNAFTPVCQLFCSQGEGVSGRHPLPRQTPPSRQTPLSQAATATDGTHPTGVHSCT